MKTVLFYQNKGVNDAIFNKNVRDNCNDPFICLKEKCESMGYTVKLVNEYSDVPECRAILFLTPPCIISYHGMKGKFRWLKHLIFGKEKVLAKSRFYNECFRKGLLDRSVLVLWEGQSVCPGNCDKNLHSAFKKILTWNNRYVDGKKFIKFYLPIARQEVIKEIVPFQNKKLLVNISINKTSSFKRELYTARRQSIAFFDRYYPKDFDLYGYGWETDEGNKMFSTYRGPIKSKQEVLSHYKFSLAYENLFGEPGYVTEKIFDCLRAGTIPIYWGAPDITDYVDPGAFIDRRKFKNDRELADYIFQISETEYQNIIKAGKIYLNSENFKMFLPSYFIQTFIGALNLE